MKRWTFKVNILALLLFLFFLSRKCTSFRTPKQQELVNEQIDKLGIDEVKQFWDDIITQYGGFYPRVRREV